MFSTTVAVRPIAVALSLALLLTGLRPMAPIDDSVAVRVHATETTLTVDGAHDVQLSAGTTHVALHWPGNPAAHVEVSLSADGETFMPPTHVEIDEVGAARADGRTYGAITPAEGMRVLRVITHEPLEDLTVLALDAGGTPVEETTASAAPAIPAVIPRAGWGADESLRFDEHGEELWWQRFHPLQKFVIHHTATGTGGSNPAATVRAIYHYHAVTQGWGDIGYNYLIDSAGRVYEGRYSRDYPAGTSPTSDNEEGLVIEAGHSYGHNPGTMGIAFIGNFTSVAPPAAAQTSLVRLISWAAVRHGVDPRNGGMYINPVTGTTRLTPNIAGHRAYNQTGCPGTALNQRIPTIRTQVAASVIGRIAGPDRYATARYVSAHTFASGVPVAYVATGANFPDALAGSVAAQVQGGPVLLATQNGIPAPTITELQRLHPARIVVLGSVGVVSEAVKQALVPYTPGPVDRIAGSDRYATAAAVSAQTFAPGVPVAYVATGASFPDALAGSVAAGVNGGPVLLVTRTTIPAPTAAELARLQPARIVVLGGGGVVSEAVRVALGAYGVWPSSSVPLPPPPGP
jgi:putative cell wall-binding protein